MAGIQVKQHGPNVESLNSLCVGTCRCPKIQSVFRSCWLGLVCDYSELRRFGGT